MNFSSVIKCLALNKRPLISFHFNFLCNFSKLLKIARFCNFLYLQKRDDRKRPKRMDRKVFFSQVLLKIKHLFLDLNKVQEKLKICLITFECPFFFFFNQLFPSEIPHRRHHLHLPQSLVLMKYFSSHQHTLQSRDT